MGSAIVSSGRHGRDRFWLRISRRNDRQILHGHDAVSNRKLLEKTYAALAPGGVVAIAEFLVEPDRSGPLMGVDSDAKCNASSPCFIGKFIGKKAFPFQIPSFHRTLRASSRLGRKEYRAGSMRSGVALRVRIQVARSSRGGRPIQATKNFSIRCHIV